MGEVRRRSPDELERAIAERRADLLATVRELELRVRGRLDWRSHVRERPLPFAGAAFLAGLILALR